MVITLSDSQLAFSPQRPADMYHSDETFAQQIGLLCAIFQSYCGAACLFYMDKNAVFQLKPKVGLRVEASQIGKEFIDNVEFGHGKQAFQSVGSWHHTIRCRSRRTTFLQFSGRLPDC